MASSWTPAPAPASSTSITISSSVISATTKLIDSISLIQCRTNVFDPFVSSLGIACKNGKLASWSQNVKFIPGASNSLACNGRLKGNIYTKRVLLLALLFAHQHYIIKEKDMARLSFSIFVAPKLNNAFSYQSSGWIVEQFLKHIG